MSGREPNTGVVSVPFRHPDGSSAELRFVARPELVQVSLRVGDGERDLVWMDRSRFRGWLHSPNRIPRAFGPDAILLDRRYVQNIAHGNVTFQFSDLPAPWTIDPASEEMLLKLI